MSDVEKIKAVVSDFYATISGRARDPRDWEKLRSLFLPGATVVSSSVVLDRNGGAKAVSIDEYSNKLAVFLAKTDFYEKADMVQVEVFDRIAHVGCVYEARQAPRDAEPTRRGVHYLNLVRVRDVWLIAGMIWEDITDETLHE